MAEEHMEAIVSQMPMFASCQQDSILHSSATVFCREPKCVKWERCQLQWDGRIHDLLMIPRLLLRRDAWGLLVCDSVSINDVMKRIAVPEHSYSTV